jgi:hypothetical protein
MAHAVSCHQPKPDRRTVRAMTRQMAARWWFALTALTVFSGLVVQLIAAAGSTSGHYRGAAAVANVFCYFTIQSNLLVGVTTLLLAVSPDRPSTLFRTLRLDGLIGIAVTFVVYHAVLADLNELTGLNWWADLLLHTVVPVMAVLGWLLLGPRGTLRPAVVGWSLAFPLAWLAFTLVRGAFVDFYPYPFVDVTEHGYAKVALNCVLVAVVFVGLATGAWLLDRALAGRRVSQKVAPG